MVYLIRRILFYVHYCISSLRCCKIFLKPHMFFKLSLDVVKTKFQRFILLIYCSDITFWKIADIYF